MRPPGRAPARLPFTLTPLPGEPFGLWWHAYAVALDVTRAELTHAVGVPAATPGPQHAGRVADAAGLGIAQVDALFTATRTTPPDYVLRVWRPQQETRFCPSCLTQNASPQPEWKLPLNFHCPTHNRPLATSCPHCATPPTRLQTNAVTHPCRQCGNDLAGPHSASHPTTGLARNQAPTAAAAQHRITTIQLQLRNPAASPAQRQQAQDDLTDLTLLALHLSQGGIGRRRSFTTAKPDTAALIEAVALLDRVPDNRVTDDHVTDEHHNDDRDPRRRRLSELVVGAQRGDQPRAVPFSWNAASPGLKARIAHGRDAILGSTDRLRYATALPQPTSRPHQAADPAPARAARLPDQLWPVWALRLSRTETLGGSFFRTATIVALLLPHSQLPLREACALLPHRPATIHVAHQLRRLAAAPNGTTALRILTELGLALDHADIPIDYPRRRRLVAATDLIDAATWSQLCRRSGLRAGGARRLDQARRYLYELLTGCSLTTAPEPYRLPEGGPRIAHVEFCATMPADLVAAVAVHAEQLLAHAGIDEPLTWSPPTDWVSTSDWPGIDPDGTDPAPFHQALAARWAAGANNGHWAPTQAIADQFGISADHLRYVLRSHPIPHAPYTLTRRGAVHATDLPAGVGHRAHPHPDHPKRAFLVDLAWLRTEYTTWGRTLLDLATEIGCHPGTLRAFAEVHGLELRPRSGGNDYISTGLLATHPAQLPQPLRQALTGRDARLRLERFVQLTEHPSLNQAATHLGLHQSVLTHQLQALERLCGGQLMQRRPAPRPIGPPTPLGHQLCQQARHHLHLTPTR